jgi:hypothetical protein
MKWWPFRVGAFVIDSGRVRRVDFDDGGLPDAERVRGVLVWQVDTHRETLRQPHPIDGGTDIGQVIRRRARASIVLVVLGIARSMASAEDIAHAQGSFPQAEAIAKVSGCLGVANPGENRLPRRLGLRQANDPELSSWAPLAHATKTAIS